MLRSLFVGTFLVTMALGYAVLAAPSHFSLYIDDINSPVFSAKKIRAYLSGEQLSHLNFHVGEIIMQGKVFRNVGLSCTQFQVAEHLIACADGRIHLPDFSVLGVAFRFYPNKKNLDIEIQFVANESWRLSLQWEENSWWGVLSITNGQAIHAVRWLPDMESMPIPAKGEVNGKVRLSGNTDGIVRIAAALHIDALAFSDRSGLRAGENVNMAIDFNAEHLQRSNKWQWQSEIHWLAGEIFWQPLYFSGGGYSLNLAGVLSEKSIRLSNGKMALQDIGELDFSGLLARPDYDLIDFELNATNLKLSNLFDQILKPFLRETAFSEMSVIGRSSLAWHYHQGVNQSLILDLHDVSLADQRDRFAFYRINAHIPWQMDGATIADISFLSGQVLRVPMGAVRVPLEINQFELRIPQLVVPVLDGKLKLENFIASQQDNNWRWQFHGELLPVSMKQLTRALQIQQMHGEISGVIPKVSYANSTITLDGTLLFNIFDGMVTAENLKLVEPLGLVPHLTLDLAMKNLDLSLLTRTFSFGNMQGRIDMDMQNLELAGWRPVKFDAKLSSSAGSYPRRISQAAIQNISALGGASAVAAIQRSFLRFFEEFTYSKIGWQCLLRNNVCRMDGIEPASASEDFESQGYVIVKGGGIPAITVIGYNRNVGWQELINRLKRITQGNEPVIQ